MIEEIEQQPAVLEKTFRKEIRAIEDFRRRMQKVEISLVVLVARGTSDNAALFGRYLIEMVLGLPVSLAAPSVTTLYGTRPCWKNALVVGLSQSGESTDTNLILESAKEQGALTIGITNEPESSMARIAEEVFLVHAGRERSVAATKTYTGQMLMLYLLCYALGARFDPRDLQKLPEITEQTLRLKREVAELSERYRYMSNAVVVGRGLNYANAFEFSLKMMETCYVVAERFSGADFYHGPIALIERAFPAFVFAPPGPTLPGSIEMLNKLRELQAETIVIGPAARKDVLSMATRSIGVPGELPSMAGCPEDMLTPIPYIIPAQLFSASLAEQKGLDPDRPRTLTKITKTI